MGSDQHYAEEAPVHRVRPYGFWIDRTPVTDCQPGAFVNAAGHVMTAEILPQFGDPRDVSKGGLHLPNNFRHNRSRLMSAALVRIGHPILNPTRMLFCNVRSVE